MKTNPAGEAAARYSCFAMALLCALLAAAGCDAGDSQAKLQSSMAENEKLQREARELRNQIGALRSEVEELRRRKDVIYTVRMVVDFSGVQGPAAQAGAPAISFLTAGRLAAGDGTTYRFLGRNAPGSPAQAVPELIYQPIDASQWTALRIGALSRLETLTLDFPASFAAAGVAWGESPHLHARFEVNGIEVADLDAAIDPAAAKTGEPLTWNVQKAFESVAAEYTRQLNRRAG